eukprot:1400339-Rhodomonas_salina.1
MTAAQYAGGAMEHTACVVLRAGGVGVPGPRAVEPDVESPVLTESGQHSGARHGRIPTHGRYSRCRM